MKLDDLWDILFVFGVIAVIVGIAMIHGPTAVIVAGVAMCGLSGAGAFRHARKPKPKITEGRPANAQE